MAIYIILLNMQKTFEELTLKEYNTLLASKAPTPGGGSALCQMAAMACSLIEMAINVTLAKALPENVQYLEVQRELVSRAQRGVFRLSNDDAAAFGSIAEGLKMPKETTEQVKARASVLQKAYHRAALVPLDVMGLCKETARVANVRVLPMLSKYIAGDCVIAVDLLRTVVRNSMLNVRANTELLKNEELAASLNRQGEQILLEMERI